MVASLDLDPTIGALLGETTTEIDVARKNRVFCNRNLRMDSIEMIGFDMDYTLALYHQDKLEKLSIQLTLQKMISNHGFRKLERDERRDIYRSARLDATGWYAWIDTLFGLPEAVMFMTLVEYLDQ